MIIVSGCSWSDSNFWTPLHPEMDCSWPKWFDYINTSQQVLSVGQSGNSNSTIIDKAMEHLLFNPKVTNIVLALSDWSRFPVIDQEIHPDLHWWARAAAQNRKTATEVQLAQYDTMQGHVVENSKVVNVLKLKPRKFMPHVVNDILLKFKTLKELCKAKGVNLYTFQMILPVNSWFTESTLNAVIKNKIFQEMDANKDPNVLNFPFFQELGGSCMQTYLHDRDDYESLIISELDYHPNEKGQKLIGDWFNEQVKIP